MSFCKHCGLRLTPTAEQCPYCGEPTTAHVDENDLYSAAINMPPEHVLRRRRAFPIRDALYTPSHPEYPASLRGTPALRRVHWVGVTALLAVSLILLISVYSLLSSGFNTLQGFLLPTPGSLSFVITATSQPIQRATSLQHKASSTPLPSKQHKRTQTPIPHATPTARVSSESALLAAKSVITSYYQSINIRDYTTAYAFWLHNPLDYASFATGFAQTQHDTIIFDKLSLQNSNTVRVPLTVQAVETFTQSTSAQLSTYQGYYLVQQQSNRQWKILAASFKRI